MNKKRNISIALGTILLLLVGFLAGRFLTTAAAEPAADTVLEPLGLAGEDAASSAADSAASPARTPREVIVLDNGHGPVQITFADAPELPDEAPTTGGLFLRRQDNSLFVGTGSIEVNVEVINGETSVAGSNDGPEVEVVITPDTIFYEDITESPIIGPEEAAAGEMVVQRLVRPVDDLDALSENMSLRVWGEKRGDRVFATVIYYDQLGL